jgi:hypothetical protein
MRIDEYAEFIVHELNVTPAEAKALAGPVLRIDDSELREP